MSHLSILNGVIPASIKLERTITTSKNYHYDIEKGPVEETVIPYPAQSASTSNLNFIINTQSKEQFLDRKFLVAYSVRTTFTGTPLAGSPLLFPGGSMGGKAALRYMPIQTCTNTISMNVNGTAVTFQPSKYLEPFMRYSGNPFFNNLDLSVAPSCQDRYQEYSQGYQENINVLGNYFDSNTPAGRGSFDYRIISDAGGVAVVDVDWYEPMCYSPLLFGMFRDKGFYGLSPDTTINMSIADITRIWSIDEVNGPNISNIDVQFNSTPTLYGRWMTGPISPPISEPQYYPMKLFQDTTTPTNYTLAAGSIHQVTSTNFNVLAIPDSVLIYLRERDVDRNWGTTDTYANIQKISLQFNGKAGILSSADSVNLYRIACENGIKDLNWHGWERYTGSPLLLRFGKDIPMGAEFAVDMEGQYSFQVQVTYKNIGTRAVNYDLIVVFTYGSVLTLREGQGAVNFGLVPSGSLLGTDIQEAAYRPDTDFHDDAAFFQGGSFLDTAKKLGNKVKGAIDTGKAIYQKGKDIYNSPLVQAALPYAKAFGNTALDIAKIAGPLLLAAGASPDEVYDMLQHDGGYSPMELRAAGLTGGGLTGGSRAFSNYNNGSSRPNGVRPASAVLAGRRQ